MTVAVFAILGLLAQMPNAVHPRDAGDMPACCVAFPGDAASACCDVDSDAPCEMSRDVASLDPIVLVQAPPTFDMIGTAVRPDADHSTTTGPALHSDSDTPTPPSRNLRTVILIL
jgi:hypothetical protein